MSNNKKKYLNEKEKLKKSFYRIDGILSQAYGTPDLGNKVDPLEELIYLLFTQRTRIDLGREVFEEFIEEFKPFEKVFIRKREERLKKMLSKGGRGNIRYKALTGLLTEIKKRVGEYSLAFLKNLPLKEAEEFLISLPWVGQKTAYCVLMYSLGHSAFAVDSNIIRVFNRTGVLDNLNIRLQHLDHRTAQKKITTLVPSEITYSLHVNTVVHGREVCKTINPLCEKCPIRHYCKYFKVLREKEAEDFKFNFVDLFSGAGGLSYGFAKAGLRPVLAVDNRKPECETYRLNIPWINEKRILTEDITKIPYHTIKDLLGETKVDIIIAGVPCQGFSRVGLKTKPKLREQRPPENDRNNRLFLEVARWAKILKPNIVLIENVPDMKNTQILHGIRKITVAELLKETFSELGYSTAINYLNSADFGIPEKRKRLFFVATAHKPLREDTEEPFLDFWRNTQNLENGKFITPFKNALLGLPRLNPGTGDEITKATHGYPKKNELTTAYENFVYDNPLAVFNHIARYHNEDDMLIISSLRKGENYKQVVTRKPEVIRKRKKKVYTTSNFHDKFFRLDPDKPCRTIVSHLAKDGNSFIHPFENRSITVREAARAQSFPDSFIFPGSRTSQFIQVGNAVPPLIAYALGRYFLEILNGE